LLGTPELLHFLQPGAPDKIGFEDRVQVAITALRPNGLPHPLRVLTQQLRVDHKPPENRQIRPRSKGKGGIRRADVIGWRLFVVGCWLLVISYSLLVIRY